METTVERVKKYLMKKYNCHIIILYGSYFEGDYTPESDIDILCFTDSSGGINDTSIIDGVQLDVWVVNSKQLEKPNDYLHIIKNEVLLDLRGEATYFINEISRIYNEGPEFLNENQRIFLKSWLIKMQKRTKRNDAEGLYRYHWLLTESLEIYFRLNNLWYLGVKKSLRWLEINDP